MKELIEEYGEFLLAAVVVFLVMLVITLTMNKLGKTNAIVIFFKSLLGASPSSYIGGVF